MVVEREGRREREREREVAKDDMALPLCGQILISHEFCQLM